LRKKTILLQLSLSYLLILLVALAAVNWHASRTFRKYYLEETKANLMARASLLQEHLPSLTEADAGTIQTLCEHIGKASSTRITVVLPSGKVLADTDQKPSVMDNHADRPEIVTAFSGHEGSSTRYSYTLEKQMMYVAVPLKGKDGDVIGVVRTSMPLVDINKTLFSASGELVLGFLVVAAVAAAFSLIVSRRITRPLAELQQGAEYFAKGDLQHKLAVSDSFEIGRLADAMNRMAAELDRKINDTIRQRNEQEAVLSSMLEGVLAVDTDERVININDAASRLLALNASEVRGRSIHEVARSAELQRLVRRVLSQEGPVETDLVIHSGGEKFIHAQGTILRDHLGSCIGAVLILSDTTRMRRLENVRRDFVANVSHELKTPITSIKGFIETLLDGAIHDPEDAHRFLSIIANQATRLNALIEDLLALAKIEQEAEREQILLAPSPILHVIEGAVQACEQQATEKNIRIDFTCPDSLVANINPPLLEQALINLIVNAVKYSEEGKTVNIVAENSGKEIIISVRDEGRGIEEKHLPHLFERFYRVDKARSRKLGGTGLGLAIVKHIMQAHDGKAAVESTPGKGSIFSLHLPQM
jgi:two-component system phosphate regulon sensor histidine kinase PhoR